MKTENLILTLIVVVQVLVFLVYITFVHVGSQPAPVRAEEQKKALRIKLVEQTRVATDLNTFLIQDSERGNEFLIVVRGGSVAITPIQGNKE